MNTFSEVIEKIQNNLSYNELWNLMEIIDCQIDKIGGEIALKSHDQSMIEYHSGKLTFSSDFEELKNKLDLCDD
jgi:hypothetical protein